MAELIIIIGVIICLVGIFLAVWAISINVIGWLVLGVIVIAIGCFFLKIGWDY